MQPNPPVALDPIIGSLRTTFYFILIFSFGLFANMIFLWTGFFMPFNGLLAYKINSHAAGALWTFMQWVFESHHSALITFSGDVIPPGENAIILG